MKCVRFFVSLILIIVLIICVDAISPSELMSMYRSREGGLELILKGGAGSTSASYNSWTASELDAHQDGTETWGNPRKNNQTAFIAGIDAGYYLFSMLSFTVGGYISGKNFRVTYPAVAAQSNYSVKVSIFNAEVPFGLCLHLWWFYFGAGFYGASMNTAATAEYAGASENIQLENAGIDIGYYWDGGVYIPMTFIDEDFSVLAFCRYTDSMTDFETENKMLSKITASSLCFGGGISYYIK